MKYSVLHPHTIIIFLFWFEKIPNFSLLLSKSIYIFVRLKNKLDMKSESSDVSGGEKTIDLNLTRGTASSWMSESRERTRQFWMGKCEERNYYLLLFGAFFVVILSLLNCICCPLMPMISNENGKFGGRIKIKLILKKTKPYSFDNSSLFSWKTE